MTQRVKIGSGGSGTLGVTALKASFLYGALTDTFFTEDANMSASRKFLYESFLQNGATRGQDKSNVSYLEV